MTQAKPDADRAVYRNGKMVEYDGHAVLAMKKSGRRILACKICTVPFQTGRDTIKCNYRARCPVCDRPPPTKMQLLLRFLAIQDGPLLWQDVVVGVWLANPSPFSLSKHGYPDSHAVTVLLSHAVRRRLVLRAKRGHYKIAPGGLAACSPETAEPRTT